MSFSSPTHISTSPSPSPTPPPSCLEPNQLPIHLGRQQPHSVNQPLPLQRHPQASISVHLPLNQPLEQPEVVCSPPLHPIPSARRAPAHNNLVRQVDCLVVHRRHSNHLPSVALRLSSSNSPLQVVSVSAVPRRRLEVDSVGNNNNNSHPIQEAVCSVDSAPNNLKTLADSSHPHPPTHSVVNNNNNNQPATSSTWMGNQVDSV